VAARCRDGLSTFLAAQAARAASLVAVAAVWPGLWSTGLWSAGAWPAAAWLPSAFAAAAGAIIAVRAGQFAIALMMTAIVQPEQEAGLPGGSLVIGLLERGLVFTLILAGQPGGIGFLIAAKSILRFGTVASDRAVSEYVIIGTLASFGWAMLAGFATQSVLPLLAPDAAAP
jgi:hypothetical protein